MHARIVLLRLRFCKRAGVFSFLLWRWVLSGPSNGRACAAGRADGEDGMARARNAFAVGSRACLLMVLLAGVGSRQSEAADAFDLDVAEVAKDFAAGRYEKTIQQASEAVRDGLRDESWSALLAQACLTVGRLEE